MPTNRPPEAKEHGQQNHGYARQYQHTQLQYQHHGSCSTSTTQLQYQHHAVAVPAPRQFEVARPASGCRASPQRYLPSHVSGPSKFAWGSDTGGQHEVRDREVRGKGGPYTVGSPAAGRFHGPARTPQFHRTRGGLRSRLCDPRTRRSPLRLVRIRQPDVAVGRWCF